MEILLLWILCAVAGYFIAKGKGRGGAGFALGLFLGPIGLIICFFLKENRDVVVEKATTEGGMKKCPFCAELIRQEATVCRYCNKDLP
jgi:hypothetical protein